MKFIPHQFEISFFKISCYNWINKKEKLKILIEENNGLFVNDDPISKLNTTFYSKNFNKEVSEIIKDELKQFEKEFEQEFKLKVIHKQAWFQIYNLGEEHTAHTHGLGYSGVLFVNFIKDLHQPTHFLSPFISSLYGVNSIFSPDINEGDILFFPSNLVHYIPSNRSNISRIIAGLNFSLEQL